MERIDLAQDRDIWQTVMNMANKFRVQINEENSLTSCGITLFMELFFNQTGLEFHLTKRVMLQ